MKFHHIAFETSDIQRSIDWYKKTWNAHLLYQDETWALIEISGMKIAFVIPGHHPPHIGFEVDKHFFEENVQNLDFKFHRDGSKYCYIKDPDSNVIEVLSWDYDKQDV